MRQNVAAVIAQRQVDDRDGERKDEEVCRDEQRLPSGDRLPPPDKGRQRIAQPEVQPSEKHDTDEECADRQVDEREPPALAGVTSRLLLARWIELGWRWILWRIALRRGVFLSHDGERAVSYPMCCDRADADVHLALL